MSIKIKNNYDCDGSCNMVENYYYDAKKNNRQNKEK